MADNGLLANSVGKFIGTGLGRGIGLMFIIMGLLIIFSVIILSQYPRLRLVEDELPDAIEINYNKKL